MIYIPPGSIPISRRNTRRKSRGFLIIVRAVYSGDRDSPVRRSFNSVNPRKLVFLLIISVVVYVCFCVRVCVSAVRVANNRLLARLREDCSGGMLATRTPGIDQKRVRAPNQDARTTLSHIGGPDEFRGSQVPESALPNAILISTRTPPWAVRAGGRTGGRSRWKEFLKDAGGTI